MSKFRKSNNINFLHIIKYLNYDINVFIYLKACYYIKYDKN